MRFWIALLAMALCAWLPACALFAPDPARAPHRELASIWLEYRELPAERALAVAGELRRDSWVAGAAGGYTSLADAETQALAECLRRRKLLRIESKCQLYAQGDEVVWPTR